MFFIVVLLYIAFTTMFGQDKDWQKSVTNLLIAAIVINFSRTICGLIIDFSQVIMLTFVNGLKDAAGGNFVEMFQLQALMTPPANRGAIEAAAIQGTGATEASATQIITLAFLALTMVGASLVMTTLLLVFLVVRIVYIWVLIILSPMAFFLKLSPVGGAMWGKWYDKFKEQVITGPVLAFFLWLALLTSQQTNGAILEQQGNVPVVNAQEASDKGTLNVPFLGNFNLQGYITSLALLAVGMMAARQVGGSSFGVGDSLWGGIRKRASGAVTGAVSSRLSRLGGYGRKALTTAGGAVLKGGIGLADKAGGYVLTKGKYNLSELPKVAGKKLAGTAVGKAIGLNEEYNKQKAAEHEIEELKKFGKKNEAEELEKKLINEMAGNYNKKKTPDQLKDRLAAGDLGEYEERAARLAMATKGRKDVLDMHGIDEEEEYTLREALEKSGDNNAWIGYDRNKKERVDAKGQIQKKMNDLDATELNSMFKGIGKGVHEGVDGKTGDRFVNEKLDAIDSDAFNTLNQGNKNQVLDALKVAAAKDPTSARGRNLQQKILEFTNEMTAPLKVERDKATDPAVQAQFKSKIDAIEKRHLGMNGGVDAVVQGQNAIKKNADALDSQRAKIMAKGGELHHAVPDFAKGSATGSAAAFAKLNQALQKDTAGIASNISPKLISQDNGNNEVSRAILGNMDVKAFQKVVEKGAVGQSRALMDAAKNMADIAEDTINSMEASMQGQYRAAKANAAAIVAEYQKADSLLRETYDDKISTTAKNAAKEVVGVAYRAAQVASGGAAVVAAPWLGVAAGAGYGGYKKYKAYQAAKGSI
jgi:hypothetical protein